MYNSKLKMKRSKWKLNIFRSDKNKRKGVLSNKIQIRERSFVVDSSLINKKVLVYNGKTFYSIFIDKEKVGRKFGEFSFTRKKGVHKKKKRHGAQSKSK